VGSHLSSISLQEGRSHDPLSLTSVSRGTTGPISTSVSRGTLLIAGQSYDTPGFAPSSGGNSPDAKQCFWFVAIVGSCNSPVIKTHHAQELAKNTRNRGLNTFCWAVRTSTFFGFFIVFIEEEPALEVGMYDMLVI
jgi:hypothetical protein